MQHLMQIIKRRWATCNGAFLFYTCLPLPPSLPVAFEAVASVAPLMGLWIGGLSAGADSLLQMLGLSPHLRSGLTVCLWLWLTGGLHLDGAMDTADGLAVPNRERRLEVMADSRTGAFGAMAAIAIVLLKVLALSAVTHHRWFALCSAAAWGRWGQQWAIGRYPYLKAQGKGAFHKQAIPSGWHTLPWAVGLALAAAVAVFIGLPSGHGWVTVAVGVVSSLSVSGWLARRLGGHTGDTYGAVGEWVETAVLVGFAACA